MTETATKHYDALCDMPNCMCVACEVYLFLTRGLVTTTSQPYIIGTVVSITEVPSGGVDVVISYDNSILPDDPDTGETVVITFGTGASDGTACDPDCKSDCAWVDKVIALIGPNSSGGVISRDYQIFGETEEVADTAPQIPKIPFPTGFKVTGVWLTCYAYDPDTTGKFHLLVNTTLYATYEGNLSGVKALTILHDTIPQDAEIVLQITNVVNGVYGAAAKGLVIEFLGVIPTA